MLWKLEIFYILIKFLRKHTCIKFQYDEDASEEPHIYYSDRNKTVNIELVSMSEDLPRYKLFGVFRQ